MKRPISLVFAPNSSKKYALSGKVVINEGAGSVRVVGGVDGMRVRGGGGARAAHPHRSWPACPGVEEQEDEGDLGPSSAGPQQKLGPGISASSNPQGLRSRLHLSPGTVAARKGLPGSPGQQLRGATI